jgi:hypothetical protein
VEDLEFVVYERAVPQPQGDAPQMMEPGN